MPMKMLWLASVLLCVSWSNVRGQNITDLRSNRHMSLMEHTLDTLQAINSRLLSMETRQQTIASRLESIENRQQSTESRLESIESRVLNGECSDHEIYGGLIKHYVDMSLLTLFGTVLSKSHITRDVIATSPILVYIAKGIPPTPINCS